MAKRSRARKAVKNSRSPKRSKPNSRAVAAPSNNGVELDGVDLDAPQRLRPRSGRNAKPVSIPPALAHQEASEEQDGNGDADVEAEADNDNADADGEADADAEGEADADADDEAEGEDATFATRSAGGGGVESRNNGPVTSEGEPKPRGVRPN
jgi:hypothetical protein